MLSLSCGMVQERPNRRRLANSFNNHQYRWDVQERSGSIRLSTLGLTINRRSVLDLLDESFDRSEEEFRSAPTAPVSLVFQTNPSERLTVPSISSRATIADSSFSSCISNWFVAPISKLRLFQHQQPASHVEKSTSYSTESEAFYSLSTSTARLPAYQHRQLEPLLFYRPKLRRPLPNLPPGVRFPSRQRITPVWTVIHLFLHFYDLPFIIILIHFFWRFSLTQPTPPAHFSMLCVCVWNFDFNFLFFSPPRTAGWQFFCLLFINLVQQCFWQYSIVTIFPSIKSH